MARSEVSASHRVLPGLLVFLVFSAAYLYSFPQSNVFYAVIVLLHVTAGIGASLLLALHLLHFLRNGKFHSRLGWLLIVVGAVLGLALVYPGTPRLAWMWLSAHMVLSSPGAG